MIDFSQIEKFAAEMEKLASNKSIFAQALEKSGTAFLELVVEELKSRQKSNTDELLSSFKKGDQNNVWDLDLGGLRLEVGTNLEYASFVNDGHWNDNRFVPGTWNGNTFNYDPNANTGMMLKAGWVEGYHYWDTALLKIEGIFQKDLDTLIQQWIDKL